MAKKQTVRRDNLGEFKPKFAKLNDDVLFCEVWLRKEQLFPHDSIMITISAFFSADCTPV